MALTTFNLAIGNTDAHARNASVLHDETGGVRLASAYDVAMHLDRRRGGRFLPEAGEARS